MPDFTPEQREFLDRFSDDAYRGEAAQYLDLVRNCTNKYQFAKTYRVYRSDLERTEGQLRDRIGRGDLGPGVTTEVAEEMIRIGREAVTDKMERCATHFERTWGEPITNFAGKGSGCLAVVVAFVAFAITTVAWLH